MYVVSALVTASLVGDTLGCAVLLRRLHDAFFAAAQEAGLPQNADFNEWSRAQVSWSPQNFGRSVCGTLPTTHGTCRVIVFILAKDLLIAFGGGSKRAALFSRVAHPSGPYNSDFVDRYRSCGPAYLPVRLE
jgi:hypothetical protein